MGKTPLCSMAGSRFIAATDGLCRCNIGISEVDIEAWKRSVCPRDGSTFPCLHRQFLHNLKILPVGLNDSSESRRAGNSAHGKGNLGRFDLPRQVGGCPFAQYTIGATAGEGTPVRLL